MCYRGMDAPPPQQYINSDSPNLFTTLGGTNPVVRAGPRMRIGSSKRCMMLSLVPCGRYDEEKQAEPGPGDYGSRSSLGRQLNSMHRSVNGGTISRTARFKDVDARAMSSSGGRTATSPADQMAEMSKRVKAAETAAGAPRPARSASSTTSRASAPRVVPPDTELLFSSRKRRAPSMSFTKSARDMSYLYA